ncbi:MAG: DUF881 domain-containing protein [Ruminococcaceae bacterium]|nr:DUF881 domain-containing protein [Oscillospiraceae bacterium]
MMKNNKSQLTIGIVVLILAFLITIQGKSVTVNNAQKSQYNMRVEEILGELSKLQELNKDLEMQLEAYRNDIAQYRKDAEESSDYSKFLSEQLKRAELMAGFVDVEGPGITITLNDASSGKIGDSLLSASDSLIHDEDLRRIINELSAAGAEAICVNGSRIISTSAVRCVGPTILVNDTKMTPPYVIKAIGKPEQLAAAMNLNGGVIDNMKVWGFGINITQNSKITIPKYSGTVNFANATAVESKEEAKKQ